MGRRFSLMRQIQSMRSRRARHWYRLAAVIGPLVRVCMLLSALGGARASQLPAASDVLKRVQARMEAVCEDSLTNRFSYIRTNVIEELDGSNKVKKRTVKTYEV